MYPKQRLDTMAKRNIVKEQNRVIPPPMGTPLRSVIVSDIKIEKSPRAATIEQCDLIASYNLLAGLNNDIYIPGRPPAWTPLPPHTRIKHDTGDFYRDENAARFPNHPMEPAVKSIFHLEPNFDTSDTHVFACGSTLGDLLRMALDRGQAFSFIAHAVGDTVFFIRRNNSPTEVMEQQTGFGHSFPEANTTWSPDVVGSASHQRIVSYRLGGLNFLVRFEADGYTLESWEDDFDALEDSDDDALPIKAASAFSITGMGGVSVTGKGRVKSRGKMVSQASVFDIKTRSSWKNRDDVLAEQLPRLWVRQIRRLVLAFHTKGLFTEAKVMDVSSDLRRWENENALALQKYAALVGTARDAARKAEGGKVEVRCSDVSKLEIRVLSKEEGEDWDALPEELEDQWIENGDL